MTQCSGSDPTHEKWSLLPLDQHTGRIRALLPLKITEVLNLAGAGIPPASQGVCFEQAVTSCSSHD